MNSSIIALEITKIFEIEFVATLDNNEAPSSAILYALENDEDGTGFSFPTFLSNSVSLKKRSESLVLDNILTSMALVRACLFISFCCSNRI